jgi:peptidoglycan hydrolase CwlO-like protein
MKSSVLDSKEYPLLDSRPRALAQSFRMSRDNWKRKCQEAKAELKSLRGRIRDLELSRDKWRDDAEMSQNEERRLQNEIERLQSDLAISAEAIAQESLKKS